LRHESETRLTKWYHNTFKGIDIYKIVGDITGFIPAPTIIHYLQDIV